jgi:type II secretory pathway predicted ATPase ExeA
MYLEHFGLNEPPFRITPLTQFFFSGAHRGEILDALVYSIGETEGIIKVSGEVGSGKTMLCRILLERLPKNFEAIYLANPSLSRKEMLNAISDALGLDIGGERIGIVMNSIQKRLEQKAQEGKRVVVLVDEAHAMPLDTLEELRLLYNMQSGDVKLLKIVLLGQPELNTKLNKPNMRQLKDCIVHHFNMQPLSRKNLEDYLMFRMHAAGYQGSNIFSREAVKRIAEVSCGSMRRINILADKSLLAAFVEDVRNIEPRHVQAAMRDCEIKPPKTKLTHKFLISSGAAALLLAGLSTWWIWDKQHAEDRNKNMEEKYASNALSDKPHKNLPETGKATETPKITPEMLAAKTPAIAQEPAPAAPPTPVIAGSYKTISDKASLFEQRLAAGKQLLEQKKAVASIQLFYREDIQISRIESFLDRANGLGKLQEIYLLPSQFGNKKGLRVLYGAYPSVDEARNAVKDLPKRYQEAFTASVYLF